MRDEHTTGGGPAGGAEHALYEARFGRLAALGSAVFQVDIDTAEELAHDVLLSFLRHSARIDDAERWLDGAMSSACRMHLGRAGTTGLDSARLEAVFRQLTPRCQHVLRLHVHEGLDAAGVAAALGVSERYAARLITRSIAQAQEAIEKGERP